jgi:hypothetical protein
MSTAIDSATESTKIRPEETPAPRPTLSMPTAGAIFTTWDPKIRN